MNSSSISGFSAVTGEESDELAVTVNVAVPTDFLFRINEQRNVFLLPGDNSVAKFMAAIV